jgi:hypothetical protein
LMPKCVNILECIILNFLNSITILLSLKLQKNHYFYSKTRGKNYTFLYLLMMSIFAKAFESVMLKNDSWKFS